jgi:hypothetical protein
VAQSQNSAERTGPAENLPGSILAGPGSRSGFAVVEIAVAATGTMAIAAPLIIFLEITAPPKKSPGPGWLLQS